MTTVKIILLNLSLIGAMSLVTGDGYITEQKAENMKLTKLVKELRDNRVTIK